jgi:hypothetical protein
LTNSINEWTKVVMHPLGLAGFALFLVFSLLAKLKRRNERRWLFPAMIAMAGIALLGGLGLAYTQLQGSSAAVVAQPSPTPTPVQRQVNQGLQRSSGPGSPNVQGVQGDVTITVDQSSGKPVPQETEAKKAKKAQ